MQRTKQITDVTEPIKTAHQHPSGWLRSPNFLGKHPMLGVSFVLFGALVFAAIALSVQSNNLLVQVDMQFGNYLHAIALQSSPLIRDVMIAGFYIGEQGVLVVGAILALYFLYKNYWLELGIVLVAWLGEGGIWLVIVTDFNRARPVFDVPIWHQMTNPTFPSGHAFGAFMCYGILGYVLVPQVRSRAWQVIVSLLTVLVILYVGFSRLFVGDHYLTDVLAGYPLGIFWCALVGTALEGVGKWRSHRKPATRY